MSKRQRLTFQQKFELMCSLYIGWLFVISAGIALFKDEWTGIMFGLYGLFAAVLVYMGAMAVGMFVCLVSMLVIGTWCLFTGNLRQPTTTA